ncbi:MAG: HAMP domain-containing protein [Fimbriimonadaceae bacterium]|nr:HAMP domain-containing protein [Fimbriimonadaceae bacterium]
MLALLAALIAVPAVLTLIFILVAWRRDWIVLSPAAIAPLSGFATLLALGALAAAVLLQRYVQQRLIAPLQALRDRAAELGTGELARRITLTSDDELAEAAAGLNQLADQITALTGGLESSLADRTRELGRAMGELHLLQKLNDAIIHNIPSGIAVVAEQGRLLYVNAGFERIWQIHPQQLGEDLRQLGAGGPLGEIDWAGEIASIAANGEPQRDVVLESGAWPHRRVVKYSLFLLPPAQLEVPLRLVGEQFCLAVLSPPDCAHDCRDCYAHTGQWAGRHALLLIDDVTEQHQLEAQLIQSEKLAALGQLSAGVAHEIRNPLSAIYGAAFYIGDVLTDEVPDLSDVEEYVKLIQRNVERAQRIVTDILNFARPSDAAGGTYDLADLAAQTLAILDKSMVDQGIELRKHLERGLRVQCRAETVKQALLNLIVNGMQAMPAGGTLTVSTGRQGAQPVLMVEDTGVGIPAHDLGKIFNPFFTTKPAGQGTGLGLSIARQAIENDGGRMELDSQVGRGTTFRVYLPPAAAVPEAVAATEQAAG